MTTFARRAALALTAFGLLVGGFNALPATAAESGTVTVNQQISCTGAQRTISVGGVNNPTAVDFGPVQTSNASFSISQVGISSGCTTAGWRVTLIAAGSGTITASNVATESVANPTLVSGQPTLPTTGASANGPLNAARTVMTAAVNTGNGLYAQAIPLKLTIPAYTAPGTYALTVTATVISGPQ